MRKWFRNNKGRQSSMFEHTVTPANKFNTGYGHSHDKPFELWHGLWIGSKGSYQWHTQENSTNVLVPLLDSNLGGVWDKGWQGELYYVPIQDMGVLPQHILERVVEHITGLLAQGKSVGIFCFGGHGRTGYLASCIIGRLLPNLDDPIEYVRNRYCHEAVESIAQVESIADFLGKPSLKEAYSVKELPKETRTVFPPLGQPAHSETSKRGTSLNSRYDYNKADDCTPWYMRTYEDETDKPWYMKELEQQQRDVEDVADDTPMLDYSEMTDCEIDYLIEQEVRDAIREKCRHCTFKKRNKKLQRKQKKGR